MPALNKEKKKLKISTDFLEALPEEASKSKNEKRLGAIEEKALQMRESAFEEENEPSVEKELIEGEEDEGAAETDEYDAAIEALSSKIPQEAPPEKTGLIGQALIGLAPALIGLGAGGYAGGATGAQAGLLGLKTLRDLEKDEAERYSKREMERLKGQAKAEVSGKREVGALRKERNMLPTTKDTQTVVSMYSKLKSSAKEPSAAGDLSMVFAFMKMLDPASVVREGEQASAANAAGVPDRIRNLYNKVLTGEKLNPEQRADFLRTGSKLAESQMQRQEQVDEYYRGLASKSGMNPEDVIVPFGVKIESPKKKEAHPVDEMSDEEVEAEWLKRHRGQ